MSLRVGDIIKCRVIGIQIYGVFVNINDEYTGLIHISEISNKFVNNITDFITINELVYARVLEIDEKSKKVKLSLKNIKYRGKLRKGKIHETPNGFNELKKAMPIFINKKLNEYILKERT